MLTSLRLHNFRCFEGVSVDIGPGLNLFLGGNGEGKTTVLEGACVLLRLQSAAFRIARAGHPNWKEIVRRARQIRRARAGISLPRASAPGKIRRHRAANAR